MNQVQNIVYRLSLNFYTEQPQQLVAEEMQEVFELTEPMQDIEMTQAETMEAEDLEADSNYVEIRPIIYENQSIQHYLNENLIKNQNLLKDEERQVKITQILSKYDLFSCLPRLLKPVGKTDSQGFIYAYFCDNYPGCFKVGRTRVLPTTRIQNQVKTNNQFYTTKKAFYCSLHMLVEKCIHLELAEVHFNETDCTLQGYTEWFRIDWDTLQRKIRNVIRAVEELVLAGLL